MRRGAKRKEFLKEVLDRQKEFFEFHKKRISKIKRNAYLTKNYLTQQEKNEQKKLDREEVKRLDALKNCDFDAYINLINTQRNSRLMQILEQTHKYLEQLGAKVCLQKAENSKRLAEEDERLDRYGNLSDKPEQDSNEESEEKDAITESEKIKENLRNSSKIYYNITHSIKEDIPNQPHLLSGGVLKPYQLFGLNWMVSLYNNNLNGILADEMGLGKTIQTISLFAYLIGNKGNEGPFLIVVPLVTIQNWVTEFAKWAPSLRVITYKGKKNERPALAQFLKNEKFHVVITTYEYILNDKSTLCKLDWQYIVVDEGHRVRNTKSKFASTLG